MTERLSPNFTRQEFERSDIAERFVIRNVMGSFELNNAKLICVNVLERVRAFYDKPVVLSSAFRNFLVNRKAGGTSTSAHLKGRAADFRIPGVSVERIFMDITTGRIANLDYDQIIQEFGSWIHISYNHENNRMEKLRAVNSKGKTVYTKVS